MQLFRQTAFLLCGPSLSGKSTAAKRLAEYFQTATINADDINADRGLPFGAEGLPESVWAETLRVQIEHLHSSARVGRSIVVDDTLCYRWLRDRFRQECETAGLVATLLVFRVADAELFHRRETAMRDQSRPVLGAARLQEHLKTFQWPSADENAIAVDSSVEPSALLGLFRPDDPQGLDPVA